MPRETLVARLTWEGRWGWLRAGAGPPPRDLPSACRGPRASLVGKENPLFSTLYGKNRVRFEGKESRAQLCGFAAHLRGWRLHLLSSPHGQAPGQPELPSGPACTLGAAPPHLRPLGLRRRVWCPGSCLCERRARDLCSGGGTYVERAFMWHARPFLGAPLVWGVLSRAMEGICFPFCP